MSPSPDTETIPVPTPWPTRPDGSNKTMGEMTPDEQRAQWKDAVASVKRDFENPAFRAALRLAEGEE